MRNKGRLIALGSVLAVAASVPLVVTLNASAAQRSLATGKTATASSVETAELGPAKAVDGSTGSRWASAYGAGTQWLQIDLGAAQAVNRVVLRWEVAYAKAYQVQVSDDAATWRTAFGTTTGNGDVDDLKNLTATGRYVRVLATQRATQWGYSLWEVEVHGPAAPAPSTPVPPVTTAPTAVPTTVPPTTVPPATTAPTTAPPTTPPASGVDLDEPRKKDVAMQIVSTAENSSLNWRGQFGYIEDIRDGRGYTAGIIGFCSGTSDMLALVREYTKRKPDNVLAKFLPALQAVNGSASHAGLDDAGNKYTDAWKEAAKDPVFQQAQEDERDRQYFNPSLKQAKADGIRALGQFAYYDAAVMHGFGGMKSVRTQALKKAKPPAQGGDEVAWLHAFLDARVVEMKKEAAHDNTSRVDTAQRVFLNNGNLDLNTPLVFKVYGQTFRIN